MLVQLDTLVQNEHARIQFHQKHVIVCCFLHILSITNVKCFPSRNVNQSCPSVVEHVSLCGRVEWIRLMRIHSKIPEVEQRVHLF